MRRPLTSEPSAWGAGPGAAPTRHQAPWGGCTEATPNVWATSFSFLSSSLSQEGPENALPRPRLLHASFAVLFESRLRHTLHPKEQGCEAWPLGLWQPSLSSRGQSERTRVSVLCPFLAHVGQPSSQSRAAGSPDSQAREARTASLPMALAGSFCGAVPRCRWFRVGQSFHLPL